MWPDRPYAPSRGSFERPVPMPTVDPDSEPTKTVAVSCQWLPYIRGALMQLMLQATWDPASGSLDLVQARAATLISMFEECASLDLPFSCSGDFRDSSTPFGLWTLGPQPYHGVYVPSSGYQTSCGVGLDGNSYCGIVLTCQLDAPALISNVGLVYDAGLICYPLFLSTLGVYDEDNHAVVGTPLTSGTIVSGPGQVYNSGAFSAASSKFTIFFYTCDKSGSSGSCDCAGNGGIISVVVNGTSKGDPCLVPAG